jgi:hypothetical protein
VRTCYCTNQCPACGQCCQVRCEHRGTVPLTAWPVTPQRSPQIEVKLVQAKPPLTEDDVRRLINEALDRVLEEVRALKGDA